MVAPLILPKHTVAPPFLVTVWALLLAAASSCTKADLRYGPGQVSHDGLPVESLTTSVLKPGSTLGLPGDITVVGRYVVVLDLASDSVLHVFDPNTLSEVQQFGRRGGGPCEFRTPWSLDTQPGETGIVWVYDIALRRLTKIDVDRSVTEGHMVCGTMITLITDAVPTGPLWFSPQTLGSAGLFWTGRIGLFDANGRHTSTVGSLPPCANDVDPAVRQHAYRATLVRHPAGRLVAAATRYASVVQVFSMEGDEMVYSEGPLKVRPRYRLGSGVRGVAMQTGPDLRFGYVDAAAASNGIYALFSGRTREAFAGDAVFGQFVHVFSWAGSFERVLRADTDLLSIALDSTGETLYGVRHTPTPAIVRYYLGASDQVNAPDGRTGHSGSTVLSRRLKAH